MKRAICVIALVALLVTGVASARESSSLTVFAAASLSDAFPKIAPHATYSFAGSNTLAAQIRQGAPADVFASANLTLPNGLYKDHFCSKPVVFTRNRLVVIVPRSNPANVHTVYDLRRSGVKIVIAAQGVPVGSYTLQVLKNMNLTSVLSNVVSRESDVREVLAKVALNEADAGFVYSTDAKTVPGKVRVLRIPAWAQPKAQYGICIVSASAHKAAARAFVKRVMSKAGQKVLVRYGFLPRVKKG
ncbi:MAG TPA: molybdate ABC transporter substrate-binding protein [Gaiellaceae bacterium]|nr:molybdate ABC transporter substrate-binding protein [Gaiellaceae bacterium]